MLAYGMSADIVDKYLRLGRISARTSLLKFAKGVIAFFGEQYLRRPTNTYLERLIGQGERHEALIKCIGSGIIALLRGNLNIKDVAEKQNSFSKPWHRLCNDFNVLYHSPVFDDVLHGSSPGVNFTVNGQHYNMGYYLTDGIYPQWTAFIYGFSSTN
ncbi:uncharacterized protein LOC130591148 [Beta vulgaris subsp. vulgaris]|uniref:uncharacterized protein LOC130591148 n=1 Tax=Beta vulgaris subsp. vulgaris TaxID=3555 RepID=UPI0009007050|nr:uncharacterized protein LOC130591148 [Beta vulgaris subsp. vulgaris]